MSQDLSKRTRAVEDIYNTEELIKKDIKIALDIIKFKVFVSNFV